MPARIGGHLAAGLWAVGLVSDGLRLKVKVAEKPCNDPAFHRSPNKSHRDDEIAIDLSRGPIALWVKRDQRFTMKPTRSVLRREREPTGKSSRVDLDLLNPAQLIGPDESSAEWVKAADEGVSKL